MTDTINYDVIILGGGASGMMAAIVSAERGKRVLLLEKNKRLGEKLRISGGGRCNITNAEKDTRLLLANYRNSEKFLHSPFAQFGVEHTFSFFEERGLPLVVEAHNRAFPKSQKASDVVGVLERSMEEGGVTVKTNAEVSRVVIDNDRVAGIVVGSTTYTADSCILATGGVSHPETGSTGDGFAWLRELGHTVISPTPTIVPLSVNDRWVHALSGVSLSHMKITFYINGVKAFSKTGSILFTHFGISGPLILNSASDVADLLEEGSVTAIIDCFPDENLGELEERILGVFDANKNKMLKNIFSQIVPPGTAHVLLSLLSEIDPEKSVHSVTKDERKIIVRLLKALPLTIRGLMGHDRAVVADGGVPLVEMDMKTMRSKLIKNLYITGDLLHINRPSGGFSLQLCWTTGFVAGTHA